MWLKLAWRNVWRNRLRTGIQSLLIGGTVYVGVVFHNLALGNYRNMIRQATRMGSGDVAIYDTLWFSTRRPSRFYSVAPLRKLLHTPEVKAFYERLYLPAFAYVGLMGFPVNLVALDMRKEAADHPLLKGHRPDKEDGAILGRGLAERLHVRKGDRITLTVRDAKGELKALPFTVDGILDVPIREVDCCSIFGDIGYVRRSLGYGDGAHEVAIMLKGESPERFARKLNRRLPPNLRAYTWREAMRELVSAIAMDYSGLVLIMLFLYVVVSIGTANVLFMSVMDRTREFGVMRAMGMKPRHISLMVALEGLLLGTFATAVGLSLALLTNLYLSTRGIDLKAIYSLLSQEGMTYGGVVLEPVIRSTWEWKGTLGYSLFVVILSLLASYFPARYISGIPIGEALRK